MRDVLLHLRPVLLVHVTPPHATELFLYVVDLHLEWQIMSKGTEGGGGRSNLGRGRASSPGRIGEAKPMEVEKGEGGDEQGDQVIKAVTGTDRQNAVTITIVTSHGINIRIGNQKHNGMEGG